MINSTNESSQISSKFWKPRVTPKEEPSLLPITWQLSHKPFKPIPTRYRVDIIALAVSPISGISIGSRLMPVHPLSPVERPFLRALYAPARTHARTHASERAAHTKPAVDRLHGTWVECARVRASHLTNGEDRCTHVRTRVHTRRGGSSGVGANSRA